MPNTLTTESNMKINHKALITMQGTLNKGECVGPGAAGGGGGVCVAARCGACHWPWASLGRFMAEVLKLKGAGCTPDPLHQGQ
jgi:hypothetical protein